MIDNAFEIFALASADWDHPGPAVAAARAGGAGILDLEFCCDQARAEANFRSLLEATRGRVGLRVAPGQYSLAEQLIGHAGKRSLTLVLAGPVDAIDGALARDGDRRIAEITDAADPDKLAFTPDALIAKGHEAAGWVGTDTSYILTQKLTAATGLPVIVRGGVGLRTAAACRVAGAHGVVLDDQLLLLAESPLPEREQAELARLNGTETHLLGELLDTPCRLYARAGSDTLAHAEAQSDRAEGGGLDASEWRIELEASIGWNGDALRPLGQGIGVAGALRERYGRVGKLVQAIERASAEAIEQAAELGHMAPGAPLAASHNTHYPLVQGPMTRVSDSAAFCKAVSENGALPFLALALMRGDQVRELLADTQAKLGSLPWGVGILGFVPQQLRDEQISAIFEYKPPFALIAGGRPDQAAEFEQRGIPAYIHAPAPALLRMYLEQGARRFVFEGRECGGHIGPLASFPLWEQMIDVLLNEVEPGTEEDMHVLFAGGVSDDRSSAMLAALTAPLAARGMKVGALMGSAYLFTEEIVDSGAVVPGFREQAVDCRSTMSLVTGPGHATRCSDTRFAHDFYDRRRGMLGEGYSHEAMRDELEDLNLGRLRMASKGRTRDESGALIDVEPERQITDGMYMIGQVATMRDAVLPMSVLHETVTTGGQALLEEWRTPQPAETDAADPCDIAIVGIDMLVPGAEGAEAFWANVLHRVNTITEVPRDRWDWQIYYDPDPSARDKVYSKWGGFISETVFDPLKYGIPPMSMKVIDPVQLLALEACSRALDDAGLSDGAFDRENTSVILGAGGGLGELGMQYGVRAELPRFVEDPDDGAWDRLPEWGQESFAGSLQNVSAGRTANRLDLGGLNFTVDAACGSSLAAVTLATQELESGRSNVAIAGGVDTVNGPFGYLCFSKTQALSPKGEPRAFDSNADGIAISEGASAIVMKRLADAERDGDRIYSVIRAAGGSSDGKALGMTAPRPEGQMRALDRAYRKAGFPPTEIDLIEAHGTGTPVGDRAEAETITSALKNHKAEPRSVAMGSVKTILGHTKCAAGVTGLIKVALSLHHRTLPAHVGVDQPIEPIADHASPVYLPKQARPWLPPTGRPRRGAVSAFGFGGTNFHAVLEEYRDEFTSKEVPGSPHWPHELFVLRAADAAEMGTEVGRLITALRQDTDVSLASLAYSFALAAQSKGRQPVCLAFTAQDLASLTANLEAAQAHMSEGKALPPTIKLAITVPETTPKIGFLFPGQGSQYVDMGAEPALYLEELRAAIEYADEMLADRFEQPLSRVMWPQSAYSEAAEAEQTASLTDTRHAQPAIGALEVGYLRLAQRLGLSAEATAGHSYGEYSALLAAGVIDEATFLNLSAVRGKAMAEASEACEPGGMAAVRAARADVEAQLAGFEGVAVANHNTPDQTVISGPRDAVESAVEAMKTAGFGATSLPVSGAFHTELVAAAQKPLSETIATAEFYTPNCAVYSNTLGARYSDAPDEIRATLDRHMLSTVEFVTELEAMYADGVRLFVELGPKNATSRMAEATLAAHDDAQAVSLDGQGGGLRGLLTGLAGLLVAGVDIDVAALYEPRDLPALDLSRLADLITPNVPKTAWLLSGGCARPLDEPVLRTGKEPALNRETKDAAIERARTAAQSAPAQPAQAPAAGQQPAAPTLPQPAAANGGEPPAGADEALAAYHQTMRQFLSLQEQVMTQYLGGQSATAIPPQSQQPEAFQVPQEAGPVPQTPAAEAEQPAPAATPEPVAPEIDYRAALLSTVAELTGYPEDMLAADADLEADLGIDSIKRVEIMGSFQKKLPAAVAEAMQADMESFTRARTMDTVLIQFDSIAPADAASQPAAAAPTASEAADIDYRAALVATVAELTGYPEDMLASDADLEADLGIDSIKRVEIMGSFQKKLPAAVAEAMQADMENFTRARSLDAVLTQMDALPTTAAAPAASPAQAPAIPPAAESEVQAAGPDGELPRFVVRPHAAPLADASVVPEGLILLAGPGGGVHDALSGQLTAAGANPVTMSATDADGIAAAVAAAREAYGPVQGVFFLHGLAAGESDSLDAWRAAGDAGVKALFHLVAALGDDLAGVRLFVATWLGGALGRDGDGGGSSLAGGAAGFIKCLTQEYPETVARLVDFNGQSEASIAERLLDEYRADDSLAECGYNGDARYRALTVAEPLSDTPFSPDLEPAADWVVLATGGARGITADILAELVQPGMTVALVGRSPEPGDENTELAGIEDPAALKKTLLEQAKAAGETPKPVEIDHRHQRVLADREIRANLARLRAAGANVEYHAADVREQDDFGAVIDGLYERHGRIDAVLHGAGVIEDKLLADKTTESFDRVFGTKTDSAWILSQRLRPEGLKVLAFFTSVAGRFGNAGQADYASANEAVARLAWRLSREWSDTRVIALNWGPWDAGMATEGVKRAFRERGVEPIPIADGARYFVRELAHGHRREVELVVGQGPWALEEQQADASDGGSALPLIRGELRMGAGGALILDHRFSLESDPYLTDHVMDGKPVLPATVAAEWMAQMAAAGWPGWQIAEVTDLRVLGGVVLDEPAGLDVQFSARASSHSGVDDQMVTVEIRPAGRKAPGYRASVRLVERLEDPPVFKGTTLAEAAVEPAEAYDKYLFHGPRFQLLTAIDGHAAEGVDARAQPTAVADWLGARGEWLLDPGLLDCGPQLAMIWTRLHQDASALPSAFGAIRRYGHEPLAGPMRLALRFQPAPFEGGLRYDVAFVDANGHVRFEMRDVEGTASAALNWLAAN